MQKCTKTGELRAAVQSRQKRGKHVVLVPTMGNLHQGHISLVKRAKEISDCVVVSIFVNPLQFGANEDLDSYPRTLDNDQALLADAGTTLLFVPSVDEMYPNGQENQTGVFVPHLRNMLCGESRPGHFDGVTTVVTKLFNMVQPNSAVFGQKDYQQLAIIRRMVSDLSMPIDVIGSATIRESDGLAMSSRNNYLTEKQRNTAPFLQQLLQDSKKQLLERGATAEVISDIEKSAQHQLTNAGFEPDYFSVRDANSLSTPNENSKRLVILAAAKLGKPRLIDNIEINLNKRTR